MGRKETPCVAVSRRTRHDCSDVFLPKTFGVGLTSVGGTRSGQFGNTSTAMIDSAAATKVSTPGPGPIL